MTLASESRHQYPFDFVAAWAAYNTKTQRLNEVFMDTFRRLSEVRTQAGAEAFMEGFSHMVAIVATQSPGPALAGWVPLMQSAQRREAQVQQRSLEIWASAVQATTDLYTEGAIEARAGAPGTGMPAAGRIPERRVSAVVINFPDRRTIAAGTAMARAGTSEVGGVKRRAATARR